MRPINEVRITATYNYIKEFFRAHGVCPTYRNIKEECNYTSLSLVSGDITKLKERGLLVDDEFKKIKLVEQKDSFLRRYDYPFLIATDALYNIDLLNNEEKTLLDAQNYYLQGNYEQSEDLAKSLLETSNDQSVLFGSRLTLCWSAMYTGNVSAWQEFFRALIRYQSKTISEKMEKELIAHFLTGTLGSQENCPSWLSEGRFYDLRRDARPLANLLFVSNSIKEDPPVQPRLLEPLCSDAAINHNDICQVYMDLYLAMAYHYAGDDKYLNEHLMGAIETCRKHNWLTPLAEMKKTLGGVLWPLLDEELVSKVDDLYEQLQKGYEKIYTTLVEKNPTKDLTFREVEIINYIRLDYETKEIANKLYLSPETVKHYLGIIYSKLGVSGRKELKQLIKQRTK